MQFVGLSMSEVGLPGDLEATEESMEDAQSAKHVDSSPQSAPQSTIPKPTALSAGAVALCMTPGKG